MVVSCKWEYKFDEFALRLVCLFLENRAPDNKKAGLINEILDFLSIDATCYIVGDNISWSGKEAVDGKTFINSLHSAHTQIDRIKDKRRIVNLLRSLYKGDPC
tara:strand:+ start:45169 stop:45477 length:309 start_codon:yes stop_codon:yes gene_type:complete